MNILVFSWRDPKHPLAGGAEQVMHEHMKGWVEAGHDVTFFTSLFKGGSREQNLDGVNIIRRNFQYWGVHFAGAYYYLFGNHKEFDLVVDQFHGIPFFTPLYVRVKKLAVLQEVAREVWLKNDLPSPLNKIVGWIGFIGEPLLFLPYKNIKFMVGSNSAKEDLAKMRIRQTNVTVVPHGTILHKPKKFFAKEKRKTVIHLGALAKDKGIEDSIRTFGLLNKKAEYQFWIVGKGAPGYLEYLGKLVREVGIEDNTTFFGFVSELKKSELLSRAHVLVNPSLLEGFGLVNVEANAWGTPVVGYTSRGLVDSIKNGESGYLVAPNTPKELAEKIESMLRNKMKYKKLSESSIKWSKNFSWDKSRRKSLSLVENINNSNNLDSL